MDLKIEGGKKLKGRAIVNASKNSAVGLLLAALLNRGKTTLRRMPRTTHEAISMEMGRPIFSW